MAGIRLHPYDPALNTPRKNADGSVSTELTRTVQLPDGHWANVPSLWWGDGSTVRDFNTMNDDQLSDFAARYEADSGDKFPRYQDLSSAEGAAKTRSNTGGGAKTTITGAPRMPNNFIPAGNSLADFYSGRMAPPIKLPNGQYIPAPNTMPVEEMYRGIYPPAAPPAPALTSRSVSTVPIDPRTGNPIIYSSNGPGFTAPTMGDTRTEQAGSRYIPTQGVQPAGTVTMPPGVRPASIDRAYAQMGVGIQPSGGLGRGQPTRTAQSTVWDPFGTSSLNKNTDRLPANAGEREFMAAFYPDGTNPAVGAINEVTVNGGRQMPPVPRQRPGAPVMPLAATVPAPARNAPPLPASYTIKKGDTLTSLAKRFGTTVGQLANANDISNPNKIRAGSTLKLGFMAPPVPRMPPPALGRSPVVESRSDRFTNLDPFGNII